MATYYLINSIQFSTVNYIAGSLLDSNVDPITQIQAQGGVLVASSDATVAAAAAVAQAARKIGASVASLNTIMLAGYEKSIAASLATTTAAQATSAAELTAMKSTGAALTNADATIQVTAGRNRTLPSVPLTANRVLTLGTIGAVAGDMITITRLDTAAYTYTIANGGGGGGNLFVMPVSKVGFVQAMFDGTNWNLRALGISP